MVLRMVNFGGLNLTDINSCLASELVISLSFQSRDLSSRIYVPAKKKLIKMDSISKFKGKRSNWGRPQGPYLLAYR